MALDKLFRLLFWVDQKQYDIPRNIYFIINKTFAKHQWNYSAEDLIYIFRCWTILRDIHIIMKNKASLTMDIFYKGEFLVAHLSLTGGGGRPAKTSRVRIQVDEDQDQLCAG